MSRRIGFLRVLRPAVGFLLILPLAGGPAAARPGVPVLHEPISPDPREDLALHVLLDGDLPAALDTRNGIVPAPDPRQVPSPEDAAYGPGTERDTFVPDRETKRPDVRGYDDPFTPSVAPFKRLEAFDGVRSDYRLYVRDTRLTPAATLASPAADDESFFGDLVVDVAPDRTVRIPTVGPGARIVRAHLGVGATDLPMRVLRDGADNWFLQAYGARGGVRARLVMELVIPRLALGGPIDDVPWTELPLVAPLPENVAREAAVVRAAIGVSRRMRPRAAIAKLVEYFRGFTDSDDPPRGHRSVYLDLALTKKGVCRHRAFAFLVTAQSLGLPARMVLNEAHAWVEINDGRLWRRIDLGGAGRMPASVAAAMADRPAYDPPADTFGWPRNADRGDEMLGDARAPGASRRVAAAPAASPDGDPGEATPGESALAPMPAPDPRDERPPSSLTLSVAGAEARRGLPLAVRGSVQAEDEACPHVAVDLWLRGVGAARSVALGTLATGDDGSFAGAIVVPVQAPLGDYDVVARTAGDARCGAGTSE